VTISTTSPNHEGGDKTDSAEVWMVTVEAAWTEAPVDVLRTLFLDDLLSRPMTHDKQTGSLVDRTGSGWMIFDIDGTREAARQRALPKAEDLPEPFRRLDEVCAPGYKGRKRGEVVRTRTTVSQAHS
jgi:hypothetical protein